MLGATAWFSTGFLVGQAWALYAFREIVVGVDIYYLRFASVVALEVVVAALAFVLGARIGRLSPSPVVYVAALVAGVLTNATTVGAYAAVPRIGAAQIEINVIAIGVLAAAWGWLLARLIRRVGPHAG